MTGETCSSGDWRQAYANYLVEYIKLYKAAGITIDFIGFLNEPELSLVLPTYHVAVARLTAKLVVQATIRCSLMAQKPRRS